jgi:hypothetical protein
LGEVNLIQLGRQIKSFIPLIPHFIMANLGQHLSHVKWIGRLIEITDTEISFDPAANDYRDAKEPWAIDKPNIRMDNFGFPGNTNPKHTT